MSDYALFLGTGASLGVPLIGCRCPVCTSKNYKDTRWRSSLFLSIEGKKILIDAGPDLRQQALRYKIDHLDGVIFTHAHHDHTAGIDDLRVYHFQNKKPLPCLVSEETAKDLHRRYYFMFGVEGHAGKLELQLLPGLDGIANFLGIPLTYFSYIQMGMQVNGLRFGNFAYVTDIKTYDKKIIDSLQGVDTLVVSALRLTPTHMHFTLDEAVEFVRKCGAKRAYITHISHDLDHTKTNECLPASIRLAYDGLQIPL